LVFLFTFIFIELLLIGLEKLHLHPKTASWIVAAVKFGGSINIPIARIANGEKIEFHRFVGIGPFELVPAIRRVKSKAIDALNIGGYQVAVGLTIYESMHLRTSAPILLRAFRISCLILIVACYASAKWSTFDGHVR
jgi:uncharacterized membrane protein